MGQAEILEILYEHRPCWVGYDVILENSPTSRRATLAALRKIRKRPEVDLRIIEGSALKAGHKAGAQSAGLKTFYRIKEEN